MLFPALAVWQLIGVGDVDGSDILLQHDVNAAALALDPSSSLECVLSCVRLLRHLHHVELYL